MNALFLTYAQTNCGVFQYGETVAAALGIASVPIATLDEADRAIEQAQPDIVIWNWHGATLGRIVHPGNKRRYVKAVKQICLLHEFNQESAAERDMIRDCTFFDCFIFPDPSCQFTAPNFHICGRALLPYENPYPMPEIPTIGSFGFGVSIKGYERLIEFVEHSYDEAIIRLHIPANWAVDSQGAIAKGIGVFVREKLTKPGVSVETSHDWLTAEGLMDWCGRLTAICLPYHPVANYGLSSSVDFALAAKRPLAVTRCGLFRHLHHLPILLEDRYLRWIVDDGVEPIKHLWDEWSQEKFRARWDEILKYL
jgi:hypothetical protein